MGAGKPLTSHVRSTILLLNSSNSVTLGGVISGEPADKQAGYKKVLKLLKKIKDQSEKSPFKVATILKVQLDIITSIGLTLRSSKRVYGQLISAVELPQ